LSTVLITMLIIVSAHLIPRQLSDWTIIALRARLRNVGRSCRIQSFNAFKCSWFDHRKCS
jgi:hypothetical protein